MMSAASLHTAARDADAGFFEDWSRWRSLDGHPRRPVTAHTYGACGPSSASPRGKWAQAWIIPDPAKGRYLVKVNCASAVAIMVSGGLDARLQLKDRYDCGREHWMVPAASWRALRAVAPRLADACTADRRRRDKES